MSTTSFIEHIKLKNNFYRHTKCRSAFNNYFRFCINNALKEQDVDVMQNYATEAELSLQVYIEKAWLWKKDISLIEQYRQSLDELYKKIETITIARHEEQVKEQELEYESALKERQEHNDSLLKKIEVLKKKLEEVSSFAELNLVITELDELELSLDKDNFTPKQSESYRDLSSAFTEISSEKMRIFQRSIDVKYNEEAADICKKSFDAFKENEKQYKKVDDAFKESFSPFYSIDNSRLFMETQMLYSHVYSYIFSKLSDEEKFNLVTFAIGIKNKEVKL